MHSNLVKLMLIARFGQINVDRSCSVIWSIVGVVCPAWSSSVDKACSSQYFDSLFAYSLLGCFKMLSSGRSIFHCSNSKRSVPKNQTSTEPFSRRNSDHSCQKTQCSDQQQQNCNLLLQIHRNRDTKWTAPEDFDIVSIFWQCNRKLKTASESTEPFKLSLKTAIEMNEVNYRPIDSRINTLSS